MTTQQFAAAKNKDTYDGYVVMVSKGRKMAILYGDVISRYTKTVKTKNIYKENHACYTQNFRLISDTGTEQVGIKKTEWTAAFLIEGKISSNVWDFYK